MRGLEAFLPNHELSECHAIDIEAGRQKVEQALLSVSVDDIRGIRALYLLRGLGRATRDARPFLGLLQLGAVELENAPEEGVIFGLTGQFWKLRGGGDHVRPRTPAEFLAFDRPDFCKAVIDFRIAELGPGRCRLTTETRVHVADAAARRAFRRYWRVIRPFSGLTRILFLREVRRQALDM